MNTFKFEIKGIAPLLMDKYVDGAQPLTDDGYVKQAEEKVYRDDDGNVAIEAAAIKACMILASIELAGPKKGKAIRQTLMAQLFINPSNLTILPERKNHDGITKKMVRRTTGKKVTTVPSYRPIIKEWSVQGDMQVSELKKDYLKQVIELAGLKYGLLGYRPEYGRFEVIKVE